MMKRYFLSFFMAIALCACLSPSAHARPVFSFRGLQSTPILHEGRIKPLITFAQAQKKYFTGNDDQALPWLRDIILNPAFGETLPAIKITNPDTLNLLGVQQTTAKLYTYRDLIIALKGKRDTLKTLQNLKPDQWTPAQADLITVQQKTLDFGDLLASMSLFLPLSSTIPSAEDADLSQLPADLRAYAGQDLTYWQGLKIDKSLKAYVSDLAKNHGHDIAAYSPLNQVLVHLSFSMDSLRINGNQSHVFRIIPLPYNADQSPWMSPWKITEQGLGTPAHMKLFQAWRDLSFAYHKGNPVLWDQSVQAIRHETLALGEKIVHTAPLRSAALDIETIIAQSKPLHISLFFYGAVLVLLGASAAFNILRPLTKPQLLFIKQGALSCLTLGWLVEVLFMLARMYILQRPPVSTLFESILFVSVIVVATALCLVQTRKTHFWIISGAGIGCIMHVLALAHSQDGDSLMMLTAVLNTNFWLATHVICIMLGYGFCVLTSCLAHYNLWTAFKNKAVIKQDDVQKLLHTLALMALLFSAVGTILGGIWADQSWGRFWGWDPKENGALLIVMWLVWVLHGRISGRMNAAAYTAGLAYTSVITALSWFGVNLLSIGLHSYGFTTGMAGGLTSFIALETLLIGYAYVVIKKRQNKKA